MIVLQRSAREVAVEHNPPGRRVARAAVLVGAAAAALLAAPASGAAAEPAPPFEIVSHVGGLVQTMVPDGGRLHVGIGSRLVVLDADTPNGVPAGGATFVPLPDTIADAALLSPGLVAVLAADTVYFADVGGPAAPRVMATYSPGTPVRRIETYAGHIFLLGARAVHVVDASVPEAAREVAVIGLSVTLGRSSDILVGDGVLYLRGIGCILAYALDSPGAPRLLGGVEEDWQFRRMSVSGRTLYALDETDLFDDRGTRLVATRVHVFTADTADALVTHNLLALVPPVPAPGRFHAVDIVAEGSRLFVAGSDTDADTSHESKLLRCWDLDDPASPVERAPIDTSGLGSPVRMLAAGGRVYLAADDARLAPGGYQSPSIGVAAARAPGDPVWLGYWQLDELGGVRRVTAADREVMIQEYAGIIHLYDGHYEAGRRQVGYLSSADSIGVNAMAVAGDRLYTLLIGYLSMFDLSSRARPALLARAEVKTRLPALAVSPPYVYATMGSCVDLGDASEVGYSILVFEALDGAKPALRRVGVVPLGLYIRDIVVDGPYAYLAVCECWEGEERLALFDASDPQAPRYVEDIPLADDARPKKVLVRDGRAYVAVRATPAEGEVPASGLDILDVTDPQASTVLGTIRTPTVAEASTQPEDKTCSLALLGDYAFYACDEPVVHVVDVRDARQPVEAQRLETAAIVTDLDAASGFAYVVLKDLGLITLRARDPSGRPRPVTPAYLPLAMRPRG
jgi:hypothetical protein